MRTKLPDNLSYHTCLIDGAERSVAIINSDNLDEKTICSLPGEDIRHGGYVDWTGYHWLVVEKDYNTEVYTRAIMRQCNYLLRWISQDGRVIERWCIVEDGTKLAHIRRYAIVWHTGNGM